jgi:hypothetical protein
MNERVERWRERAAEFRQLAESIRDPSIVRSLERAARAYEGIADYVERRRKPEGNSSEDH